MKWTIKAIFALRSCMDLLQKVTNHYLRHRDRPKQASAYIMCISKNEYNASCASCAKIEFLMSSVLVSIHPECRNLDGNTIHACTVQRPCKTDVLYKESVALLTCVACSRRAGKCTP
eukprot:1159001-Pelagomonas_calceolata.AAC.17